MGEKPKQKNVISNRRPQSIPCIRVHFAKDDQRLRCDVKQGDGQSLLPKESELKVPQQIS